MTTPRLLAGLALAVSMCGAPLVTAAEPAWDYAEVRVTTIEATGLSSAGAGFGFGARVELADDWHLVLDYDDAEVDFFGLFDLGLVQWHAGFGYHRPLGDGVDGFVELSYESLEASTLGISARDDGYGLRVGLRAMATESLELGAALRRVDLGDGADDTLFGLSLAWWFSPRVALATNYEDGDTTLWSAGVRIGF